MSQTTILAAEEIIDDLCADPSLQAQKSAAPKMLPGGFKIEPVSTVVAIATVILGAEKVYRASNLLAGAISKLLSGGEGSRQVIEVFVTKEDGDFRLLHFEKGTSLKKIEDTIRDYLAQ